MGELRTFFAKKKVVEVQVPVLSKNTVTDPDIESISADRFYIRISHCVL